MRMDSRSSGAADEPSGAVAEPAVEHAPPLSLSTNPGADEPAPWRRLFLNPREPFLVPLLLLLATRIHFWRLLPFASEDAYITFRYARNLVLGYGLTYNPGDRVMGFTTPLWTVWSALGYALTRDPVAWSRVWSVGCDVLTLVLLCALMRRHASRAAAWCFALMFSLWTYFAAVSVSGMESSAMLALIVLSAHLIDRRSVWSGAALAALALIRPEGFAAAAVLALWAPGRARLIAVGGTLAGVAALWSYFGSIVPQSVVAKSVIYGTPGPLAGRHWWEWLSPFAFGRWPVTTEGSILFAMAVVAAPAAVLGAMTLGRQHRSALTAAIAAMLVVWAGYAALGVAYFSWYLAVPLAGLMALAAIGLPRIARGPGLYASLLLFVLGTWTVAPELYRARAAAEWKSFGGAAEYLASHCRAGEKVMLEPIGMVGWRCKLIVVDEVGLVSPQVSRRRTQGPGWMTDIVASEKPEWLVIRQGVLREGTAYAGVGAPFRDLGERDALLATYPIVETIHADAGDQALAILRRAE